MSTETGWEWVTYEKLHELCPALGQYWSLDIGKAGVETKWVSKTYDGFNFSYSMTTYFKVPTDPVFRESWLCQVLLKLKDTGAIEEPITFKNCKFTIP